MRTTTNQKSHKNFTFVLVVSIYLQVYVITTSYFSVNEIRNVYMPRFWILFLLLINLEAKDKIDFSYQIRPILSKYCFACHGPDKAKGKLRLDIEDGIQKSTKPGHATESELIERILTDDEDDVMPPHETGKKLKKHEIALLKQWINEGSSFGEHWAFQKLEKPQVPAVKEGATKLDKFIVVKLHKQGLTPSPETSKRKLIRRLSLDIRGITPSIDEVNAFLADNSKSAYQNLIDTFLASPLYGEKWASKWLDLARYADTKGYEKDRHREIWRYRDWVIKAINDDMPFDEFTLKQIAGDMLPNATEEDVLATAFHRNTMTNDEGGTDNEEFRTEAVKDRVDTTGTIWLGLSLGCAKCHTHKYDPVTIKEYYSLYAFFNQSVDSDQSDDRPIRRMPTESQKAQLVKVRKELKQKLSERNKHFNQDRFETFKNEQLSKWISGNSISASTSSKVKINESKNIYSIQSAVDAADTYSIQKTFPQGEYSALRLKVLGHQTNAKKNQSLDKDGKFILSYLQVFVNGKEHQLKNYFANFSEKRMQPKTILKKHASKTSGWGAEKNTNKDHYLLVEFENSLKLQETDKVEIMLVQQSRFHKKKISNFSIELTSSVKDYQAYINSTKKSLKDLFYERDKDLKGFTKEIAALKKRESNNLGSNTPIMQELPKEKQRPNFIHESGFFLNIGAKVNPETPSFLHAMNKEYPKNRLGLAKWLTSKESPLTARVAVNRLWAQIFGRGLVESEEDFGNQGMLPTHPDLLDWLAVTYMENDWSQKKILKKIFLSSTYKQSSKVSSELVQKDRFNLYLARGPRFRMTAEMIRDSSLSNAGLLSSKMFGHSVMPYQPPGLWQSTYNTMTWQTSKGENKFRRGLYTYHKRTSPYPTMTAFDAPSREICTARRIRSNTPLQSLVTLNDPVFVEAAQAFARKILTSKQSTEDRFNFAYESALSRPAEPTEIDALKQLLEERLKYYSTYPIEAKNMAEKPLGKVPAHLKTEEAAAWTAVCNVILNLDEFLTKE